MLNKEHVPISIRTGPASLVEIFGKRSDINKVPRINLGNSIMMKAKSLRDIPGGGGIFITTSLDGKIEVDEKPWIASDKNPIKIPAVLSIGGKQRLRELGVFLHTAPDVPSPTDLSNLLSGKDDPKSAKCVIVTSDEKNIAVFASDNTPSVNEDEMRKYDLRWNAEILKASGLNEPLGHKINRVLMGKPRQGWFGLNPASRREIFEKIVQENGFIVFSGEVNSQIMERAPAFNEEEVSSQKATYTPLKQGSASKG